jgi:hypothetical protein
MSSYCSRIFKNVFRFLFCKKTLIVIGILFFLLLLVGTYTFFAVRYEHFYGRYNIGRAYDIERICTAFQRFRKHEGRLPVCMDEAELAPYNKDLKLGELREILSKLPYRCVTSRDDYYQDDKGEKHKVLVTLYKPYRTQLWPFGEMNTKVWLANGSICSVPSNKIETEDTITESALSQKYELDGEYEKALIAYEDFYKNSAVRQRQPEDLTYARIYYKQNQRQKSFQEYCHYAQWCLNKYPVLKNNVYNSPNAVLGNIRSTITMDMNQDYYHMRLTPFLEYQEFLDFMEEEYAKLGSPPEYKEAMELFRDVKNKIVEKYLLRFPAPDRIKQMKETIRNERKQKENRQS